jgi:hypothetical protein
MSKKNRENGNLSGPDKNLKSSAKSPVGTRLEDQNAPSRWALFEDDVLSKVKNPEDCKRIIAQRQAQVDDDSHEADLVASFIRKKLQDNRQDADTCCLFFTTAEIAAWVNEALDSRKPLANNKVTPYLRPLGIRELRTSKRDGVPGWVWRGRAAKPGQTPISFSRLPYGLPDDEPPG